MFTWICPQCKREVPPSYTECPDCAARAAGKMEPLGDAPPQPVAPPPFPPQAQAPPPQNYPPQGAPYPPYPYPPQQPPQGYPPQPPPQGYPPQYPGYPPQQQYQYPGYPPQQYPPAGYPPQGYPQQPPPGYPPPPPPESNQQFAPPPPPPPPPPLPMSEHKSFLPDPVPAPARATSSPASSEVRSFLSEAPPEKSGLPTWLMAILFAVGLIVLIGGVYWLVDGSKSSSSSASNASATPAKAVSSDPLTAAVEVTGIRFIDDPKHKDKVLVRFLVVNHSSADLNGITVDVQCFAGGQKNAASQMGEFKFVDNLAPYQSHEVSVPFATKLKVYELPDWQALSTTITVTAPGGK